MPDEPGVYLFRDAKAQVIYVGKALRLRDRLRQYFTPGYAQTARVDELVDPRRLRIARREIGTKAVAQAQRLAHVDDLAAGVPEQVDARRVRHCAQAALDRVVERNRHRIDCR